MVVVGGAAAAVVEINSGGDGYTGQPIVSLVLLA